MAATEEQLLSLEDVANRLQVSDQSVRRWIKAGKLAAYKPGLEWRIRPSDLEEFLQSRSYPKVQAPLPDSGQERRDAFIERVKICISSRVAHYEKRLAEAEQGGVLAGYEGARLLFDDALDEFMVLPVFINGEVTERWMLDPDIPENIKVDLGFAVGEAMRPLVEIVGRIGEREKELAETEAQQAEAQRRHEQMVLQTRRISAA